MNSCISKLKEFAAKNKFINQKGPLCVALVFTRHAMKKGLPIDPYKQLTKGKGQVKGLGKHAVQSILNDYGITRVLAEEGARTSRGSIEKMRKYVDFLNNSYKDDVFDINQIEEWWIEQVKIYFSGKPFELHYDSSKSLIMILQDIFNQAQKRQEEISGSTYVGTVLQHLVGAKLSFIVEDELIHYGASVADSVTDRDGDFIIDDVVVHVTTSPSEALMRKCSDNVNSSLKPIIITTKYSLANGLAEQFKIIDRIDIFEALQFIAGNLYEIGKFRQSYRKTTAINIINKYNHIIDDCETNPSLKIILK